MLPACVPFVCLQFITEVDNLSYVYGFGERDKERVDTYGHVVLTDADAWQLSRTKALCVTITVVFTVWLVQNGAMAASMMFGA
eukprot:SAG22_NODE_550_length_9202_cov_30.666484_5_plen_83_part_00